MSILPLLNYRSLRWSKKQNVQACDAYDVQLKNKKLITKKI